MTLEELVRRLVDALESAGIQYVLVGSLSASFYGVSRSTQDADIVVSCSGARIAELVRALGDEFERDPQLSFETVTATNRTLLRVKKTGFQIEVFFLSGDEHDQQRFARRRLVSTFGHKAYILSLEDVLVTKLRWLHLAARTKDEDDLRAVLRIQYNRVDWPYVEYWCERHGTRELLDRLRQEVAPP
jgi:hypothetical protein